MNADVRLEAEQSTLGAMMLSPGAVKDCLRIVRGADFNQPRHELIFDAILTLHREGVPTDVVAVTDLLIRQGELERAGGADYLHTLTSIVPTASNGGYYATIVRDGAVLRDLVALGHRLSSLDADPGVALANAFKELRELQDRDTAEERPVRSLGELLSAPATEDAYDWIVPGLLERNDRLILTGPEGGGKSMLIRQLAILAASGLQPFTGHDAKPARVLYVDAENSERQWRREVRGLAANAARFGVEDPRHNLAVEFKPRMDITRANELGDVHSWIDKWKPDLVVMGPLYRIAPSWKNDEDALPALNALDTIRERGVALILEGHAGHADNKTATRDPRPIGSSALLRWPEFGLGLVKPDKPGEPARLVRWRGDRDKREWPHTLHSSLNHPGQTWPWEATGSYHMGQQPAGLI